MEKVRLPLWDHQKRALEKAKTQDNFAFFQDMGTGKTRTIIELLVHHYKESNRILKTLILTPPVVVNQFREEILKYSDISPRSVVCLTGTAKQRIDKIKPNVYIYIANYEALLMPALFDKFMDEGFEIIVADESHRAKNPSAKRTKALWKLGDKAKHKYIMTGTPVLNSPMDLFSQFRFMDGGKTFGENFFAFRNTYFYDKNAWMPRQTHFPNWQPKPQIEAKINSLIEPVSFKIKKEECLDLPPLVRQKIEVELSPDQKAHYEQLQKDFIAYVEGGVCVTNLAITKALRMQQIVSGHIPIESEDGSKVIRYKNTPREAALRDLLEEITPSHKVLIWAVFKENYAQIRRICEDLGISYVELHGDVSSSQRADNVKAFNCDPSVRVCIGHPGSGGIGVNLTAGSYGIFFSRNFSLEQSLQAEARNHRGGSERHEKITRIDLVAQGTIDELIMNSLEQKKNLSNELIFELANYLTSN